MILQIYEEKAFDNKMQPHFQHKNTQQTRDISKLSKHNKSHIKKPTVNIIFNDERLKAFFNIR